MLVRRADLEKTRALKGSLPCSLRKGGMLQNFHLGSPRLVRAGTQTPQEFQGQCCFHLS